MIFFRNFFPQIRQRIWNLKVCDEYIFVIFFKHLVIYNKRQGNKFWYKPRIFFSLTCVLYAFLYQINFNGIYIHTWHAHGEKKNVGGCDISKISKAYVKPKFSQHCKFFISKFISTQNHLVKTGCFKLRPLEMKDQNIWQNLNFIVIISYSVLTKKTPS